MYVVSAVDWTQVITSSISAVGAIVSAALAAGVIRRIRVPSGGTIGEKVEKTHDLAAVGVAQAKNIAEASNVDVVPLPPKSEDT